jgi:hypothetical protein
VEGIVKLLLYWELYVIGHQTDDFCDFKGAKAFGSEFGSGVCHF